MFYGWQLAKVALRKASTNLIVFTGSEALTSVAITANLLEPPSTGVYGVCSDDNLV
jgi:hypothetical protein